MPCAGSADTVQRGVLLSSAGVCDPQNDPAEVLYMGGCEWLSPASRVLQRRRVSVSGGRVLHTQLVGSGQALVPAWSPGWAWAAGCRHGGHRGLAFPSAARQAGPSGCLGVGAQLSHSAHLLGCCLIGKPILHLISQFSMGDGTDSA